MFVRDAPGAGPVLPPLNSRLRWIIILVVATLTALVGRLWQLQVVRGDRYFARTLSNVVHQRYLPSIRGKIFDRNGEALAQNRPAFNVYVDARHFEDRSEERLVRLLGLSDSELELVRERLATARRRGVVGEVLVLEDQGRDRASLIAQARHELPGVAVHDEPYRFYPSGDLAAHVLGYMNQMTPSEYDEYAAAGYEPSEQLGRYGLEKEWEPYLRGTKGIERYAVNARGVRLSDAEAAALIDGERITEPAAGSNVVLTIDARLQRIAEKAVEPHAAAAAAVVDVHTGRILALVSKPSFDPNVMTGHLSRAEYSLLVSDPRKPFIDKTLRVHYPPGSTYKFVIALAALEDGAVDETDQHFCPGYYAYGRQRFHCMSQHGKLSLLDAIKHSCNVYFWKLTEGVDLDRMAEVAHAFGLGLPTGLGLNGDVAGRIPTRAWYEERTSYKPGYAVNAATGQGDVEVTVLQLVMAYAAIANGGTLYLPQVVERLETAAGEEITSFQPIGKPVGVAAGSLELIRRGMWKVVNEPGGTVYSSGRSSLVQFAGKTGTAQVRGKRSKEEEALQGWHPERDHAWFAGFAPAENPEIAVVVLVEHGGSGGRTASPVARDIIEGYLHDVKGVPRPPEPGTAP